MTDLAHLIQDLRAHAPEAPSVCAALMRRAASELEKHRELVVVGDVITTTSGKHRRPKEAAHADS